MMSQYYRPYHRWERLAEFNFDHPENNSVGRRKYIYCVCSRVNIRDTVSVYYVDTEEVNASEVDGLRDSYPQVMEDQSHVHFSLDTSNKVKCETESASCYGSASHTENYCSTDEHDQVHFNSSNAIQPSDSGADLTYQDYHSDIANHDKIDGVDQDFDMNDESTMNENYFSEDTWDKFWAINRERIIWASWIKKYSDYINPSYLDENNDLVLDENNIPKPHSSDPVCTEQTDAQAPKDEHVGESVCQEQAEPQTDKDDCGRERKFSYDSKVNPYKKIKREDDSEKVDKSSESTFSKEEAWLPLNRRRSCSEHERIVSPRTFVGTDSMTNVTKMTLSSHDVTSSHMTSESTSTDEYSVSSSPSDDQSNDQTRIANLNVEDNQDQSEEMDTDQYWEFLWKKHFGEQYALHYANYIACHEAKEVVDMAINSVEIEPENNIDVEMNKGESNSQEQASVSEVELKVDKINLEDKKVKTKKNRKQSKKYTGSIGLLVKKLLQADRESDLEERYGLSDECVAEAARQNVENAIRTNAPLPAPTQSQLLMFPDCIHLQGIDGVYDPTQSEPKSSREIEEEDEKEMAEHIKSTFELLGLSVEAENMPKGQLVYRKSLMRLRPPRCKKFLRPKKTYFDEDGNPYMGHESQDDKEIMTDEDHADVPSENDKCNSNGYKYVTINDYDDDNDDYDDDENNPVLLLDDDKNDGAVASCSDKKRRRRQKRQAKSDTKDLSDMPLELRGDKKMAKYWKKRHSLFHRFDEGILLDRESWFSVTPENVGAHIADKLACDTALDAFCGAGGNTIQFANTCKKVIAIDIDPAKIEMARHNALVYGVNNIEFIVGDFFELAPSLRADMVFLSPPWGGPNYSQNHQYDIETMLEPKPASELLSVARMITSNIALYLPRNTRSDQILSLARFTGSSVEIEQSYLDRRFVAITAYFY